MGELYTLGRELILLNGEDYIGPYHLVGGIPYTGDEGSLNSRELQYIKPPTIVTEVGSILNSTFSSLESSVTSTTTSSIFNPITDRVSISVTDISGITLYNDSNFVGWTTKNDPNIEGDTVSIIEVDPERDITNLGLEGGIKSIFYNFLRPELITPAGSGFGITEISPSRTEVRVQNTNIPTSDIVSSYDILKAKLNSNSFIGNLLTSIGDSTLPVVNVELENNENFASLLLKFSQPIPNSINVNDRVSLFSQVANSKGYTVNFPVSNNTTGLDNSYNNYTYLNGPNTDVSVKNKINNSTGYQTLSTLGSGSFSGSLPQLESVLSIEGIRLYPSYSLSNFDEFINFSSAKARIENFYYKVGRIESFQNDINSINSIVGSTSSSSDVSSSRALLEGNINDIIKEFDGFDYYLYFNNNSDTYPKTTSTEPYTLASTGSTDALTWLGSDVESSIYYGGALLSGSVYDENNASNLLYTIPEYIRSNTDNSNYLLFVSMIGQLFDEIWLYTKGITDKLNNTNELEKGAPLGLIEEIITSLGFQVFGNNYGSENLYSSVLGINPDGTFTPPTGSEIITNYVAVNSGSYPIDRVSKEIYKRIYSNISTLQKKKGTVAGLRQLINIYGIPDTILRISEFGGKDKVNTNDWDSYRRTFNKALTISGSKDAISTDWAPETLLGVDYGLNPSWSIDPLVPRTVEYRFKSNLNPDTLPFQPDIKQSTFYLIPERASLSNPVSSSVSIVLEYNGSGSASGSFSGSIIDPQNQYADLTLYISGSTQYYSSSINLPFLNQDWWNVMLHYDSGSNEFELYAGNKIYNGDDGTKLGFTGSTSITVPAYIDTLGYRTGSKAVIGRSNSNILFAPGITGSSQFSGSIQEVRYWTNLLSESFWHNHIMNPLSIENGVLTGSDSPVETLAFRSREGEDYSLAGAINAGNILKSIHPKFTGSFHPTSSFLLAQNPINFDYDAIGAFDDNKEIQFFNQPIIGIRNRVSDKIRDYGDVAYGDLLSPISTIQQNYEASQSYTEDTNLLEVAFSPQNEINDDIINEFGSNNILNNVLSDPRNLSSSSDYYDELRRIALKYFEKYTKENPNYYYRLIKYIDNSLFKTIKEYVPSRTSVSTGIVVKQHLLERNRVRPPQPSINTTIAKTSEGGFNTELSFQNIIITGSVKSQPKGFTTGSSIEKVSGGTGGIFEEFNGVNNRFGFTQSFSESVSNISGSVNRIINNQDEFYNGEFSGSNLIITTQSLNPGCIPFLNTFITPPTTSSFDKFIYNNSTGSIIGASPFNEEIFLSPQTSPGTGEVYILQDTNGLNKNFKISKTDKEGENIRNRYININFINANFGRGHVEFIEEGSDFLHFKFTNPVQRQNEESNFISFEFSASCSSSIDNNFSLTSPDSQGLYSNDNTIILSDYNLEHDPNNLFDSSSGLYNFPMSPNRELLFSASFDYTASLTNVTSSVDRVFIQYRVPGIDPSSPAGIFLQDNLHDNAGFINGDVVLSGSISVAGLNPQFFTLPNGQALKGLNNQSLGIQAAVVQQTNNNSLRSKFLSGSYSFSNIQFEISHSNDIVDNNPTTNIISYEPYFAENNNFDRSLDCQPLLNNGVDGRSSTFFQVAKYDQGDILPSNFSLILNNNAVKADIPDSNYTQKRSILPRYEGSKISSAFYNVFTPPQTVLSNGLIWSGDISYGKSPVIEFTKPFFGYFQLLVPTSPELENATQVKILYLIDQDGSPAKPLLNAPSFFNVEGTYESGDKVVVSLDDTLQTDDPSLVNAAVGINLDNFNREADVLYGARRVDPILTSQVVSAKNLPSSDMAFTGSIVLTSEAGVDINYTLITVGAGSEIFNTSIIAGTERTLSFSETRDESDGFDGQKFIFSSPPQTKVKFSLSSGFQFRDVSDINDGTISADNPFARLSIKKEDSDGNITTLGYVNVTKNSLLPNPLIVDGNQRRGFINLELGFLEFRSGDQVFFTVQNLIETPFSTFSSICKGTPQFLPTTIINSNTENFWSTGSEYSTLLTASISMSDFFGVSTQLPYSDPTFVSDGQGGFSRQVTPTFKNINEPFTIQSGDELRFQGREDLKYLINDVFLPGESGSNDGRIVVKVDPPVPPGLNLNQFLLRRYNKDASSVLINLIPPDSSFTTTRGIIKNDNINVNLDANIENILSNLIKEGIISST